VRVAVTGANGFVGRALVARLLREGYRVTAITRSGWLPESCAGARPIAVGAVDGTTEWARALDDVTAVVHLVALTHESAQPNATRAADYWSVNVEGSRCLAAQAAASGVQHVLFLSSIKVNGERTGAAPYRETDPPAPKDIYGRSKLAAEAALTETLAPTGTGLTVVRPPLVYGPGVRANLAKLVEVVRRGWPMPFASIDNRRSLIALDNLVDLLTACLASPPSGQGRLFLASDGRDISTPALIREIAEACGRPTRLLPCPPALLRVALRGVGRPALADKLLGSLQVDSQRVRAELGWRPPIDVATGIARMVQGSDW
jgi:UDP-glucose 4-epimerase